MTNTRVNEIDLLRFLAALGVVFFHYAFRGYAADAMTTMPYPMLAPAAKYGYLGVQLFFMISGFVILMTATKADLNKFVISRMVRLYPAFWVCCTLTFICTLWIGQPRYSVSVAQYIANMTLMGDYIGVLPLDGAYWSLFVEFRFYGLVMLVIALGKIDKSEKLLVLWVILSVILEIFPVPVLRYLLVADYSAYFIVGAMYFIIWLNGASGIRFGVVIASWCLAIYQGAAYAPAFEKYYGAGIDKYVISIIITTFFVSMLLVALRRTGFFLPRRWLVVGGMTYPLYLIHQNIGFMIFNLFYPAINQHVLLWSTVMLALAVAYLINVLIEARLAPRMRQVLLRVVAPPSPSTAQAHFAPPDSKV